MKQRIITIGRECGSGGHKVGELIAGKLDIPFYDRKLIEMVAKRSGFCGEFVEKNGEAVSDHTLFSCNAGGFYGCPMPIAPAENPSFKVSVCQTELICEIAAAGACVIVGRASDYILEGKAECLNVFFYAPLELRIARMAEELELPLAQAEKYVREKDKARSRYYARVSGQKWGECKNYHLCIDSGLFSYEKCAEIILNCLE